MMAIAIVIINLNTASMRFSRLDNKILESFISSCDRLLETELPKGAKSKEIPAGQAKFAPEILRFNPEIVRLHPDFVWVLFRDRFAVIWEHDQSTQMEWKLTVCVDGAFSRVLLRRPKGKQAGES
jgi:hypothetical protein